MVLYGYDASTFNSIQTQTNWLDWFGLDAKVGLSRLANISLENTVRN